MATNKLHISLVGLIFAAVCACGQSASPAASSSASPAASPSAPVITLESISAQPADLPAVGLQKCTTGLFKSGDLGTASVGFTDEWKTVQGAGALEGWVQQLTLACPGEKAKARVRNDLIRFRDAAAAVAFFQSEKANSRSTAIFWPLQVGTAPAEGSPTGFGPNSITLVYTKSNGAFGALWTNGALLISYNSLNFPSADGLKGALAVNARVP